MKKEVTKSPKKGTPEVEEDLWIDVHDDNVMREMGFFRPYDQKPRDPSVWTKTPYERRILKSVRHLFKGDWHCPSIPRKSIPIRAKLIIQLNKNDEFDKTTYSTQCWMHEIGDILSRYIVRNRVTGLADNLVRWYTFNGKKYAPNERPFWA